MRTPSDLKWNTGRALLVVVLSIAAAYGLLMLRFALRNDQIEYFLPVRMYMSDAFRHHEYMLWNPFIAGGYPIHCDMQGPVWNPIAVLFAWLFNYNASLLSVELLLYYVLGGVGCFYFARNFSRNHYSWIVVGVVYACGGMAESMLEYMSWVGSMAFLPWAAHFFYLLLTRRTLRSAMGLAVALWLLLVCGYPSYLIYLGYVLVSTSIFYLVRLYVQRRRREMAGVIKMGLFALLLLGLISLPAARSFQEFLPYYRNGTWALEIAINSEFFTPQLLLSLLFPVAGYYKMWDYDVYMGLLPILVLATGVIAGIKGSRRLGARDWYLLAGLVFTVFFSLGSTTPVRMWCARNVPLMGKFSFSHTVWIFVVLCLLVWIAAWLDRLFSRAVDPSRMRLAAGVAGLLVVVAVVMCGGSGNFRDDLVREFFYVSAVWQLVLLGVLCFYRGIYDRPGRLLLFILGDLVCSVVIMAPLTGLTRTSPGTYNASAARFYRSDAGDLLFATAGRIKEMGEHDPRRDVNAMKVVGRYNFPSSTRLEAYYAYVSDSCRYKKLINKDFLFSDNGTGLKVRAVELRYNSIFVDVDAADSCGMVLQQTYYWRWKAERPEYAPGIDSSGVFLRVPLKKGGNRVRLYYYSDDLAVEGVISVVVLVVIGIVGAVGVRKRRMPVKKDV